jgi:hypothetical protein
MSSQELHFETDMFSMFKEVVCVFQFSTVIYSKLSLRVPCYQVYCYVAIRNLIDSVLNVH